METLRRQLREWLGEVRDADGKHPGAAITGANAESADIRALTRIDQYQTWVVVPIGVFLILLITLRDVMACINLVATMVLTYLFALGVAHVVFVYGFGSEGLDWKVPYFLFVLLVAVGVDYNVFLMTRLQEEAARPGASRRDHPGRRPDRRADLLGRGDHHLQLRGLPVQPAQLAPPARLRFGRRDSGRRHPGSSGPRPLRPVADESWPRSQPRVSGPGPHRVRAPGPRPGLIPDHDSRPGIAWWVRPRANVIGYPCRGRSRG